VSGDSKNVGARDRGRWVVKIGSSLLTAEGQGIDRDGIQRWAGEIARLVAEGCEVVLVTSGAVAEGCSDSAELPTAIHDFRPPPSARWG
jgi:glutamate 5-kinase